MKKYITLSALLLCAALHLKAQNNNPHYNKALADSLGADEYGMRSYFLVILKSGANKDEDPKKIAGVFRGHMNNISRLVNEGKLIIAGPLGSNENNYRGIFIFTVKTKPELETILATDPAIKEQYLAYDIYEWYGSAALPKYLEFHDQVEQKKH